MLIFLHLMKWLHYLNRSSFLLLSKYEIKINVIKTWGYKEGNGETADEVVVEKINDEETVGKSFKKSSYHLININSLVLTRTARFHPMRCHEKKWYETSCFICVKKNFNIYHHFLPLSYCKHICRWCPTCDIFRCLHLVVDKLDIWLPGIQNSL